MAYMILKKRNKFGVAENHEYKKTDSICSVRSSLKSHPEMVNPVNQAGIPFKPVFDKYFSSL